MPTGVLRVNTEKTIDKVLTKCSLILMWTSKATSLSAPDELLSYKLLPIHSLPINLDFLSALEYLKTTPSGAVDEHDYFIVPKNCNVCSDVFSLDPLVPVKVYIPALKSYSTSDVMIPKRCIEHDDDPIYKWRKSWCMAEVNAFNTAMSDKHTAKPELKVTASALLVHSI